MRETKVYLVLEKLNNRERGKFLKFVSSPYFNKSQALIDIFKLIHKDLNSSQSKPFTKEKVWKKAQPSTPYDDVRFRKYLSDLQKLVHQFLSVEVFTGNEFQVSIALLDYIADRRLKILENTARRIIKNTFDSSDLYNSRRYLDYYKAYMTLHDIETLDQQKSKISTNFTELSEVLDIFYFSEKLKLHYDSLIWQRIDSNLNSNLLYIENIVKLIEDNHLIDHPPISIYYSIYQLNKHPNIDNYYYDFKEKINQHIAHFPSYEAMYIYTAGINYCIRKINTGNSNYQEELLSLYAGYMKSVVDYTGELSQWTFNNASTIALRTGKFELVKSFIKDYSPFIKEKFRNNVISYNLANYHFYQKNYDEVIKILRDVEYEDIFYNTNSKTTLLKTYYETQEYEPLLFLLESFRAYINRNKSIPESRKILFKNLIKFTKKLANLPPNSKNALEKLKREVTERKNTINRSWLLEKIEELE